MLQRLSQAVVLTVGVVLGAWVLASGPEVDAGSPGPRHVTFTVALGRGEVRVLGTIPAGRTLVLHDFMAVDSAPGEYEMLADGVPVSPKLIVRGDAGEHASFVEGFHIGGGSEFAIHRTGLFSGEVASLYVGGELR